MIVPVHQSTQVIRVEDVVVVGRGISLTHGIKHGSYTTSARRRGASRVGTSASELDNLFPMLTETWEQDEESQCLLYT